MAETRTQDKTNAKPQQMRESGVPTGQAVAVQRHQTPPRETAVQRAQRERLEARDVFLREVATHQPEIERFLVTFEISWDRFLGAVEIGLNQAMKNDEDFCVKANPAAFVRECLRCAHIGLYPDGKQAAIVRYDRDCALLPMVEGYIEILWKTGLVRDVNHNVVCMGDTFEFEEGDEGFVRHVRSLTRPADAEAIGAWCVINLMTGGKVIEIVDQADLKKIAAASKAVKGPRSSWAREMHRKAPFRRATKRMPKTERLAALIEIDDRNVQLEKLDAPGEDAPTHAALFGNKPIRRKKREPLAIQEGADQVIVTEPLTAKEGDQVIVQTDGDGKPVGAEILRKEEPFALSAVITTKNGVQRYEPNATGADLWFADLQEKMKRLEGEKQHAFWKANRDFIQEAGRNGFGEQAMKLVELAVDLGLVEHTHG